MKFKAFATVVSLLSAVVPAQAYDFMYGGVYYNILSNTTTRKTAAVTFLTVNPDASGYVTTYRGDVVIPAQCNYQMQTFNVTQVADLAMFNNQSLYSLVLPEGITAIGIQSFSHCYSMEKVTIPSTLSRIGDFAFEYCEDLTSISLPARLSTVGDGVFQQCLGLEAINVDPECTAYRSDDGVLYQNATDFAVSKLMAYPAARKNEQYTVAEGVVTIDPYALSGNKYLSDLTLPASLTELDPYTFVECESLANVYVAEGSGHFSSDDGVLLNADGSELIIYPSLHDVPVYEIPESVKTIAPFAFYLAEGLMDLWLPASLTDIGELAFLGAGGLQTLTCMAATPPSWERSSLIPSAGLFDASVYSQATLFVPQASLDKYRSDPEWGRFTHILPIEEQGAIESVDYTPVDESPAEYFDLSGRRLPSPVAAPLLIERRGTTAIKTLRNNK